MILPLSRALGKGWPRSGRGEGRIRLIPQPLLCRNGEGEQDSCLFPSPREGEGWPRSGRGEAEPQRTGCGRVQALTGRWLAVQCKH